MLEELSGGVSLDMPRPASSPPPRRARASAWRMRVVHCPALCLAAVSRAAAASRAAASQAVPQRAERRRCQPSRRQPSRAAASCAAAGSPQPAADSQQPTADSQQRRKRTLHCWSREAGEARRAVRRRAVRAGRSGRFPGKPRVSATQARAWQRSAGALVAARDEDVRPRIAPALAAHDELHGGMHGRGLILRKRAFGGAASENQLASSGACFRWGHDRSEGGPERAWRASGSPTAASRHLLPLVDHFRATDPHLRETLSP